MHHDVGDFELVQVEQAAHAVAVLLDHLPVAVELFERSAQFLMRRAQLEFAWRDHAERAQKRLAEQDRQARQRQRDCDDGPYLSRHPG